ncbi:MAG: hypothetical protein ISQ24_05310 [PS1 clade bacterium]|nr:hypothetical protein [PS1 clade bacterium]MBL6784449.1 hypothetical protein [PS1 clade bacterium]
MHRRYSYTFRRFMPLRPWALAVLSLLVIGLTSLVINTANAQDNMAYEDWPQQSRADRLGTFTYVYGGVCFVSHSGSDEGAEKYRGFARIDGDIEEQNAVEDGDDMFVTGGFGVRLPNEFNFEFGLSLLNGAYDQPTASGSTNPKPDQPVFEMSVLKSFDLGGPPLLRYTARVGFASIDDPHTDDGAFFGVGVSHEPFRVELRNYDFGVFDSQVMSVSYIYDF